MQAPAVVRASRMVVDVEREICDLRHLMGGSLEIVPSVGWFLFFLSFCGVNVPRSRWVVV